MYIIIILKGDTRMCYEVECIILKDMDITDEYRKQVYMFNCEDDILHNPYLTKKFFKKHYLCRHDEVYVSFNEFDIPMKIRHYFNVKDNEKGKIYETIYEDTRNYFKETCNIKSYAIEKVILSDEKRKLCVGINSNDTYRLLINLSNNINIEIFTDKIQRNINECNIIYSIDVQNRDMNNNPTKEMYEVVLGNMDIETSYLDANFLPAINQ